MSKEVPHIPARGIGRSKQLNGFHLQPRTVLTKLAILTPEGEKDKTIGLHIITVTDIMRKVYERMGFVRAPERYFYSRPGAVVMMAYYLHP